MVDKIDAMIEDVGQIKSEELLPLVDKVRDEVGQGAADTLKSSVETAMGDLETALQSARSSLDNNKKTINLSKKKSQISPGVKKNISKNLKFKK